MVERLRLANPGQEIEETEYMPHGTRLSHGVHCMEHLLQKLPQPHSVRVLEVGPFNGTPYFMLAAIAHLAKRNPELRCAAIGPQRPSQEGLVETLGSVPFISGELAGFDHHAKKRKYDRAAQQVLATLDGPPDIIYADHVFECSRGYEDTIPLGPWTIFEKCAEILNTGGFIVVDNAMGHVSQVSFPHAPQAKRMHLTYRYSYDKKPEEKYVPAIFVFQKKEVELPEDEHLRIMQIMNQGF